MAITSVMQSRVGGVTTVEAASDLSGDVLFYWYIDGAFVASTVAGVKSFALEDNDQARIDVLDSTDPAFDPVANSPSGYPARRSLFWLRSLATDIASYRVEQRKNAGSWTSIGVVNHVAGQWSYSLLSPRLDDLADYEWRVVPVDVAGNDGTALTLDAVRIVRTPEAPDFTVTFDEGTTRVTFAEAV